MTKQTILALSVMTASAFMLPLGSAVSQQSSLKQQLVGTWAVSTWDQQLADGSKLQRFGANPKGINVFDGNGRFFVMFARDDLPRLASNNPMKPTPEEAIAITTGAIAYYGTYTVDEASKTITMKVDTSTLANQVGTDQRRNIVALSGDELTYTNPAPLAGGTITVSLKRVKAAIN